MQAITEQEVSKFYSQQGFSRSVQEVSVYLKESFGSPERRDYGTGHELNFVVFMYCLYKIGVLKEFDFLAAVNCVFVKYMELIRDV